MANTLGTYTLKELRSDLDIRLNNLPPGNVYTPGILNHWLNLAQEIVARLLRRVDPSLYRNTYQTQVSGTEIDLSSQSCAEIEEVFWGSGGSSGQVRILPLRQFMNMVNISLYDNSIFAFRESKDKLVLNKSFSADIEAIYLREPGKLSGDNSTLDVPDEYTDFVVLLAVSLCPKLKSDPVVQQEVSNEGQQLFGEEFQKLQLLNLRAASGKEE